MVVDRLKILRFHHVPVDALVPVQHGGDIAHHVFHEFGIVVGALGDELLVRALEQAVELARSLFLNHVDEVLDPKEQDLLSRLGDKLEFTAEQQQTYSNIATGLRPLPSGVASWSDQITRLFKTIPAELEEPGGAFEVVFE